MNRLIVALASGSIRKGLPDDKREWAINMLKTAYIVGFWVAVVYATVSLM